LRLPSRVALILGLGALPTTGLQADAPAQNDLRSFGDILIRSEGGKIYLSEGGGKFQELQLRDSAEARFLKQLVQSHSRGSAILRLNPTILAGGGGTGFSWWNTKKSLADRPTPARQDPPKVTAPPSPPDQGSAPRDESPTIEKKR
jgi:hypothetical protein